MTRIRQIDDLVHELEIEQAVLRAVSLMTANEASALLVRLALRVRRECALAPGPVEAAPQTKSVDRWVDVEDLPPPLVKPPAEDTLPLALPVSAPAGADTGCTGPAITGSSEFTTKTEIEPTPSLSHDNPPQRSETSDLPNVGQPNGGLLAPPLNPAKSTRPNRTQTLENVVRAYGPIQRKEAYAKVAELMGENPDCWNRTASSAWQLLATERLVESPEGFLTVSERITDRKKAILAVVSKAGQITR